MFSNVFASPRQCRILLHPRLPDESRAVPPALMSIPPLVLRKFTFLIYQNFTLRLFIHNSRAHQGLSREICNVIHYQTIGQRKTRRIPFRDRSHRRSWLERVFMLAFLERMASKTSSRRKRRPCCCHGVCIGFLRPEAQSQEIEIEHEIMK